uniref:Uncharacterized protein n=1 Tax=Steinernema glaseri TaxID=37863 RepID=A0A1I7YL24_9BILA
MANNIYHHSRIPENNAPTFTKPQAIQPSTVKTLTTVLDSEMTLKSATLRAALPVINNCTVLDRSEQEGDKIDCLARLRLSMSFPSPYYVDPHSAP